MVENEGNIVSSKIELFNYLINYLIQEKRKDKENLTLRVSHGIYQEFDITCRKLGLLNRGRTNVALEGLMAFFIEQFHDHPTVVQQTLNNVFIKAKPQSEINVNVAQKLEIKIVKCDLTYILSKIETFTNDRRKTSQYQAMMRSLNETLPRALRIYEKTMDSSLEKLLEQSEKWV